MSDPDFSGLVRFLVEPFLDSPDSLKIDCETRPSQSKIWIRVAFEEEERGRVFGRGGRNIQAIRTVVEASALVAGWSAYLDVFGASSQSAVSGVDRPRQGGPRSDHRRPSRPRKSHE